MLVWCLLLLLCKLRQNIQYHRFDIFEMNWSMLFLSLKVQFWINVHNYYFESRNHRMKSLSIHNLNRLMMNHVEVLQLLLNILHMFFFLFKFHVLIRLSTIIIKCSCYNHTHSTHDFKNYDWFKLSFSDFTSHIEEAVIVNLQFWVVKLQIM